MYYCYIDMQAKVKHVRQRSQNIKRAVSNLCCFLPQGCVIFDNTELSIFVVDLNFTLLSENTQKGRAPTEIRIKTCHIQVNIANTDVPRVCEDVSYHFYCIKRLNKFRLQSCVVRETCCLLCACSLLFQSTSTKLNHQLGKLLLCLY